MKSISILSLSIALVLGLMACAKEKKPPVTLKKPSAEMSNIVEIPYQERGGVKVVTAKLNGVSIDMIFDTGCSGISLSVHEFETMYKNGRISGDDIIGQSVAMIADGSTTVNYEVAIDEVELGGPKGIVVPNVTASISPQQTAPVLLGNNVFDEVASVEIDNNKKVIRFKRR